MSERGGGNLELWSGRRKVVVKLANEEVRKAPSGVRLSLVYKTSGDLWAQAPTV